jgi:hypothetical protein
MKKLPCLGDDYSKLKVCLETDSTCEKLYDDIFICLANKITRVTKGFTVGRAAAKLVKNQEEDALRVFTNCLNSEIEESKEVKTNKFFTEKIEKCEKQLGKNLVQK